MFGAVAELERVYILQRQREGVVAAKARGVRFGRPTKNPPENFSELVWQIERGKLSTKDAQALSGLKEATFYRRLSEQRSAMRR